MKKIIVLLLTLIIALGLCACSNSDTANNKENNYIGTTWVVDDDSGMWDELYSFRFLPDGKVIWSAYDHSHKEYNVLVTDHSIADTGEWILDDRQIIIFNLSDENV